MTTALLKEKLHEYTETAPEKKLKAFYTIIEDNTKTDDIWADGEFITEMDRRERKYLTGNAKGVSIDEAVVNTTKALTG